MKNKLIILCLLVLIFPFKVNAFVGEVSLVCDKLRVSSGDMINCSIKGNFQDEVSAVYAEVELGNNLVLENSQRSTIWEGNGDSGIYNLHTDSNKTGMFDIGTFSVRVSDVSLGDNTSISLKNVVLTDADNRNQSFDVSNVNVRILSTINTLTNIIINYGNASENIQCDDNDLYQLDVDSESVIVEVVKSDNSSTVTGDIGNKVLNFGSNTLTITVRSESGVEKVYTLNITRPDGRNNDNSLSGLKISNGTLKFNKDVLEYDVEVKGNVDKIKVDAILNDEKASFVTDFGSREVDLNIGKNVIEIKVMAENESVRVYKINVVREDNRSDNNYLGELSLSNGKISFDKEQFDYKTVVIYDVEEIEVTAKTEDSKAKVEILKPEKLVVGQNIVRVIVVAENETVREYKITVERKAESEKLSDNNSLSNLTVSGYKIDFNSNTYEYTLKIKDENSLDIHYEQEDSSSAVIIKGNRNLKNGSIISINVTSEIGVTAVYKINIEKNESSDLILYIVIGAALLLLIVLIFIISSKKKKKDKVNIDDEEDYVDGDIAIKSDFSNNQFNASNGMQNVNNIQNLTYNQNLLSNKNSNNN